MSHRSEELEVRRAELLLRCASQRRGLAVQVASIDRRLVTVDRGLVIARQILSNPLVVVAGSALLFTVGRTHGLRLIGRLAVLATAARRLWRVARAL